jgi:hypothetical protein
VTKRLNGTAKKDAEYPRDPFGWYVEPESAVEQLFDTLPFWAGTIWDPSCGRGTVLDVARRRGFLTVGSDLVDRFRPGGHQFERRNFLKVHGGPSNAFSIVCNPPYNEPEPELAEKFVHHALKIGGWERAAFLVPTEFQHGQGRFERLYDRTPPSHVISLMERPSMPPGLVLEARGESCRKGGMAEYIWIVWTAGHASYTRHLFARPSRTVAHDNSVRRVRAGRNAASASAA